VTLQHAGRGRRLLLRFVIATPGGCGQPSVPTTRDCLQWLDAARMNAGESLRDQAAFEPPSAPGSTAPPPKIAASGVPEGDAHRRQACAVCAKQVRRERGPPSPRSAVARKRCGGQRGGGGRLVVTPFGAPLPSHFLASRADYARRAMRSFGRTREYENPPRNFARGNKDARVAR